MKIRLEKLSSTGKPLYWEATITGNTAAYTHGQVGGKAQTKIDKYTEANDTVLVPGKVLSSGELTHPITLAAFSFSKKAFKKVEKVGGTFIFIEELMKRNPTGSKIILLT